MSSSLVSHVCYCVVFFWKPCLAVCRSTVQYWGMAELICFIPCSNARLVQTYLLSRHQAHCWISPLYYNRKLSYATVNCDILSNDKMNYLSKFLQMFDFKLYLKIIDYKNLLICLHSSDWFIISHSLWWDAEIVM